MKEKRFVKRSEQRTVFTYDTATNNEKQRQRRKRASITVKSNPTIRRTTPGRSQKGFSFLIITGILAHPLTEGAYELQQKVPKQLRQYEKPDIHHGKEKQPA